MIKAKEDLIGMTFGRLTVVEYAEDYVEPNGTHRKRCKCLCECGGEKTAQVKDLKSGKTKSCGCLSVDLNKSRRKFNNLEGEKFGKLRVLSRVEDYVNSKGHHYFKWKCICDCGNEVEVLERSLKSGNSKSCGCLSAEHRRRYNRYEFCGNYVTMYTLKNEPFDVDLDDFWKVKDYCWRKDGDGYLKSQDNGKPILLHRLVMNCPDDLDVDHIEHDITDNRKEKLRIVTPLQNSINRSIQSNNKSGVTGVYWSKQRNKWIAQITVNKKAINLGGYNSFDEAVSVRKEAERKYFGDFSYDASMKRGV